MYVVTISQDEENPLREFRDRFTLGETGADEQATARLARASWGPLKLDARLAALAGAGAGTETHLNELSEALRQSRPY